ncbi:hypothetical protein IW138_005117 [Coemansia sp. RSA 986]|nr:hypothetical protein IW138_005117 [Coemansia sp. RSA 986]
MMDKKATFVDKSAAIADVMSTDAGKVIAGMYPRRMTTRKHITLLRQLASGAYDKYEHLNIDKRAIQREKEFIALLITKFDHFQSAVDFNTSHIQTLSAIVPDIMGILYRIFGRRSVLIVDKHDGSFMSTLCHTKDASDQAKIQRAYSEFLCESLKLHKGILVGVFDVRGIGLGSGLNNVESYMAHSGFVETQPTENPFQHAFGFTVHDVWYLSSLFLWKSEYRQHQGPPAEHMSLDFIDDAAVESIGSQEQPQFPPDVDKETREELADICMVRSGDTFHDMQSLGREPLQASTIMRLLYQAGYIVPIAKDRVGIPNSEVHRALEEFYERIAARLKISTNLLESIHEEMDIYKCDLQRFSQSLHLCMVNIPRLGEDTSEGSYQTILSLYLFPITRSGYAIHNEAMMENSRADMLLFPTLNHIRSDSTPPEYYIFELKRYDASTTPTSSKRTTVGNRHKVANHVFKQAMQAQTQIYERYYSTLADKARTCDLMYVVGISF